MLTDPILEQNKRLRARVAELEETVLQLQQEAEWRGDLPEGLPYLTRLEERVLRALLSRRGVASRDDILDCVYGVENDTVDPKIIDVILSHLRKKLVGMNIKICTQWGRGWYIERASHRMAIAGDLRQLVSAAAQA